MTASTPSGDAFDIIPFSWLIPSHEVVEPEPVKQPETINAGIARLIKAVKDNPTPK